MRRDSHGDELVRVSEHSDGCPAAAQCSAEALAVGVVEPEILVVELAHHSATDDPDTEADGSKETEDGSRRRAFAAARRPDLVGLELAALVEHKDADRVVHGRVGVAQHGRGLVGLGLRVEDRDDQPLLGHGARPFVAPQPAARSGGMPIIDPREGSRITRNG